MAKKMLDEKNLTALSALIPVGELAHKKAHTYS